MSTQTLADRQLLAQAETAEVMMHKMLVRIALQQDQYEYQTINHKTHTQTFVHIFNLVLPEISRADHNLLVYLHYTDSDETFDQVNIHPIEGGQPGLLARLIKWYEDERKNCGTRGRPWRYPGWFSKADVMANSFAPGHPTFAGPILDVGPASAKLMRHYGRIEVMLYDLSQKYAQKDPKYGTPEYRAIYNTRQRWKDFMIRREQDLWQTS